MKRIPSESREREKIAALAREYMARGYDVLADIPIYESPAPIEGIRPDLVAKKGDEILIVEVKTSESLKKNKDIIAKLARYAKDIPGARLDLVVTNPKPQSSVQVKVKALQEQLRAMQEGLLTEIQEAVEHERPDLVVILASRLLEQLLLHAAAKKGIHLPSPKERSLSVLSEKLASKNVVSQTIVEFASKLQQYRNAIVHGKARISIKDATKDAVDIYQKLIKLSKQW